MCGPSHACTGPFWQQLSTLAGGVISIRRWGSSVENHKTHAVDPPHHTVLYRATDCQLGAAGWPYGPCDHAGRPSPPWMMDVDEVGQQHAGGGHASWSTALSKKSHSLLATLADRREEREMSSWVMRIIRALIMMALWRGTNPHAPPAGHHCTAVCSAGTTTISPWIGLLERSSMISTDDIIQP